MSLLDEMMSEINDRGSKKGSIFELAEGQSATIRFITDGDMVQKIAIHTRFVKGVKGVGYTIPCAISYGHNCQLENKDDKSMGGNRDTKSNYMFIVFDYRDNKIKTMCYKANSCTPLDRIGNYFGDVGTLLGRDFVITRNNAKGIETRYTMKPGAKGPLSQEVENIINSTFPEQSKPAFHKFERDAIAQAYHPQLLKPGKFELPSIILNDVANIPEIEDVETSFERKTNVTAAVPTGVAVNFAQLKEKKAALAAKKEEEKNNYGEINVEDDDDLLPDDL